MDFDSLIDDSASQHPPVTTPGPISGARQPAAAPIDFDSMQSDEDRYGTASEMAKTFAEGAVKSVPFLGGAVLKGLQKLGLESSDEIIRAREETNPWTSVAGQVVGTGAAILLAPEAEAVEGAGAALKAAKAGGDASKIAEATSALAKAKSVLTPMDAINPVSAISKVGAQVGDQLAERIVSKEAASIGSKVLQKSAVAFATAGLEGAIFSGGNVVNDLTLGNPDLTGQQVLAEIGGGALLGGGLGILGLGVKEGYRGVKSKYFTKEAEEVALGQSIGSHAQAIENGPPGSMAEMRRMVDGASALAPLENTPQRAAVEEAQKFLPEMKFQFNNLQAESLESKPARRKYLNELEQGANERAKVAADYEGHQKREVKEILDKTITGIAPGSQVTDDAVKGGNKVVDAFTENYTAAKKATAPDFERIDKALLNPVTSPSAIMGAIEEAVPGVSKYLTHNGIDGVIGMEKYSPTMGFSKKVYGAMRDVVNAVNRKDLSLGEVRNVRESIRTNYLDSIPKSVDKMQIDKLRKGLMDFMQDHVQQTEPDLAVRETFKKYAINEQNREIIESIFGGKIGDRVSFAKQIKPEHVLDKIFANTVSVQAAKDILGKDFNVALADYLSMHAGNVTDATKGGFSSQKFHSFLGNKDAALREAFAASPEVLKKIESASVLMKLGADAPSANPSGSALGVLDAFHKYSVLGKAIQYAAHPASMLSDAGKWAVGKFGASALEKREASITDAILAGKTRAQAEEAVNSKLSKWGILGQLAEQSDKAAAKIESGAKSVFKESVVPAKVGAEISKALTREEIQENRENDINDFEKKSKKIMSLAQDPDVLLRKLDETTKDLSEHAPNITASMQKTSAAAVSYLASKLPKPIDIKPLSAPWKPNPTDISLFNHYYSVLEKPHSVFEMIKTGTLTPIAVDAVSKVYPDYYKAVNRALMDQITNQKERIPYRTRLMLSMFSQSDMDPSTTPRSIAMNQINLQGPSGKADNQAQQGAFRPSQKGMSGLSKIGQAATSPQKAVITRK